MSRRLRGLIPSVKKRHVIRTNVGFLFYILNLCDLINKKIEEALNSGQK